MTERRRNEKPNTSDLTTVCSHEANTPLHLRPKLLVRILDQLDSRSDQEKMTRVLDLETKNDLVKRKFLAKTI